jgi:hypothetical protein
MSRLVATPGDITACWRNAAKLQEAAGRPDDAKQSRKVARQVASANAWVREHGRRFS